MLEKKPQNLHRNIQRTHIQTNKSRKNIKLKYKKQQYYIMAKRKPQGNLFSNNQGYGTMPQLTTTQNQTTNYAQLLRQAKQKDAYNQYMKKQRIIQQQQRTEQLKRLKQQSQNMLQRIQQARTKLTTPKNDDPRKKLLFPKSIYKKE